METKANHLLIGSFVLLLAAGVFGAIVWLGHFELRQKFAYYVIHFTDSVAGLRVGGDVRFNGIAVGTVKDIDFDEADPRRVKVTVEVASNTPVRQDSYAEMEPQGITGLSFVLISGGSPGAKRLKYHSGQPPPEIRAQPSEISQLIDAAPQVLARAVTVLDNLNKILGPENQKNLASVLNSAAQTADTIAARRQDIDHIITSVSSSANDVAAAAKDAHELIQRLDRVAEATAATMGAAHGSLEDFDKLVGDARNTMHDFSKAADDLDGILAENRPAVHEFADENLPQLGRLISEVRLLVASLTRVTNQIERNPSEFLFGEKAPERRAQ